MKYILLVLSAMMLAFGTVSAESDSDASNTPEFSEIQKLDMDFEVEFDEENRKVHASWDDFPDGEGFLWYKLMYSTTNSAPVYPDQSAIYVGTQRTDVSNSFHLKYGKNHYMRLCVVTQETDYTKGRYCSDVRKIQTSTATTMRTTAVKTTAVKLAEAKEKAVSNSVSKVDLTTRLKERVDAMLAKFINRLESKDYSDEKKLAAIDRIMDKLETLKEKNERYERLVDYMMEKLETYRNEIDDGLGEIESIFEDF